MKKLILGLAATAAIAAPLALANTPANATIGPVTKTATFTAIQPAQDFGQWDNVWTHVYEVNVDANGSFEGTGVISGHDGSTTMIDVPETITGTFNADGTISLVATRPSDGVQWSLTNATTDGVFVNSGLLLNPNDPSYRLDVLVTAPQFKDVAPAVLGNHGDCVSGAAHDGVKGTKLAAIAKVVTKTGAYGTTNCPTV